MPSLLDQIAARAALFHARSVYRRFSRALSRPVEAQQRVLQRVLDLVRGSAFARDYGLAQVRTPADLRRVVPLRSYEDVRPYVDRMCDGETGGGLIRPGEPILMFATTSGTTALPKRVPVTGPFVADYRRGWNTFGAKMLDDHPRALLRAILQSTSRHDVGRTKAGIPYGAITGLLARLQKGIVRRYYVAGPEAAEVEDTRARHYVLMRRGVVRDVAFAVTASPATLIQMARTADELSETLIRDVHDGTVAAEIVPDGRLRAAVARGLKAAPERARVLAEWRRQRGSLRPCDYWRIEFLSCWTGGTMGHFLERLAEWWGRAPVRDIGLLASEGRVSVPVDDGTPIGALDVTSGVFEFIPAEQAGEPNPEVLAFDEVDRGRDYAVVLTNTTGLVRYRLDDIVRVHGFMGRTPLIEFLHRAGGISSLTGEKLSENQVVAGVAKVRSELGLAEFDYVVSPRWAEPPYYELACASGVPEQFAAGLDATLCAQNEEYESRRKSFRLGPLRLRVVSQKSVEALDRKLLAARGGRAEQYKRPCLLTQPSEFSEGFNC